MCTEPRTEYFVGIDSDIDSDFDPEAKRGAEQQLAADAPKGAPLKHGVGLFKPGAPARHSSRGRRGRIGS